ETGSAVAVLLDKAQEAPGTGTPSGGSRFGGGGAAFDWQTAASVAAGLPIWLAGGLDAGNVARAIETVRPWCGDVSSWLESEGFKDHAKIRDFVAAAKAAG